MKHTPRQLLFIPLTFGVAAMPWAVHSGTDVTKVTPQQQSARDYERIRILKDELAKTTRLLEELAKRRADRVAANDAEGTEELDLQRSRVLEDRRGLQREIDGTAGFHSTLSTSENVKSVLQGGRRQAGTALPWWDVYDDRHGPSSSSRRSPAEP